MPEHDRGTQRRRGPVHSRDPLDLRRLGRTGGRRSVRGRAAGLSGIHQIRPEADLELLEDRPSTRGMERKDPQGGPVPRAGGNGRARKEAQRRRRAVSGGSPGSSRRREHSRAAPRARSPGIPGGSHGSRIFRVEAYKEGPLPERGREKGRLLPWGSAGLDPRRRKRSHPHAGGGNGFPEAPVRPVRGKPDGSAPSDTAARPEGKRKGLRRSAGGTVRGGCRGDDLEIQATEWRDKR